MCNDTRGQPYLALYTFVCEVKMIENVLFWKEYYLRNCLIGGVYSFFIRPWNLHPISCAGSP